MRGQTPVWWAWRSKQGRVCHTSYDCQARQTHQPEASAPEVRWEARVPELREHWKRDNERIQEEQ